MTPTDRDDEQALGKPETRDDDRLPAGVAGRSGLLFEQAMAQTRMAICLSDPRQADNPIVFANRAFLDLTGYALDEVVGRNCRFLQGSDTDPAAVEAIRIALAREQVAVVEILNHRKDESRFWNALHIGPIYDEAGDLLYFFGSQWNVSNVHAARAAEQVQRLIARELSHRIKNVFAVIGAMVTLTGREERDATRQIERIRTRITALGRAHEATLVASPEERGMDLRAVIDGTLRAYGRGDGRSFAFRGETTRLDSNAVSVLALVLHELAVNATKHGALSHEEGRVTVDWTTTPQDETFDALVLDWRETGGPGVVPPQRRSGSGIVEQLLATARGEIAFDWRPDGLAARLRLPVRRIEQ